VRRQLLGAVRGAGADAGGFQRLCLTLAAIGKRSRRIRAAFARIQFRADLAEVDCG